MTTHKQSAILFERATEVIPGGIYGHLGPAEGCYVPVGAYPLFVERADGAYFWDVDGNRYIDYMCAYGPNILGYNDPDVDQAALAQLKKGNCTMGPCDKLVELAELMVDTVAMADWAFFAKNGGDTTTLAIMVARAATGRDKVILHKGAYHGVAGWTQKAGWPGITDADITNNIYVDFGDIAAVESVIDEHKGQIACFMSTPYHHPVFDDNALPPEGYWARVRELCTQEGIVLAIDDVRCGFRLDVAGSDAHFGFKADLQCFCKALANGWPISALCGAQWLKDAAASVMYTGSYWMQAVPMAAAQACVTKLAAIDSASSCKKLGAELTEGLASVAADNGFHLDVSGASSMWFMRTTSLDGVADPDNKLHQSFVAECVRRGVFFTNHHNLFINTAMTSDDIAFTLGAADEAYKVTRRKAKSILSKEV